MLPPFMAAELGEAFSLDAALAQGMVPVVWGAADPMAALKAYVGLYVREEVQMEGGWCATVGSFSLFSGSGEFLRELHPARPVLA